MRQYVVATPSNELRLQTLRNTYLLLALSMIPTAFGALVGVQMSFAFLLGSPIIGSLVLMGVLYFLMFMVQKNKDSFAGIVWMMLFTFFMGALLGPLLQFALRLPNGSNLVLMAAVLTGVVFAIMSALAFSLKRELSSLTSFLAVGGVVIMVAVLVNIFMQLPMLHLILCGAFVIFSSLMILWQLNQIVMGGESNYIVATLSIYVSLYNLFTSLLQILIALSGNDRK
jgi:modulator of FtsH protease